MEQGIFWSEQGIFGKEQEFSRKLSNCRDFRKRRRMNLAQAALQENWEKWLARAELQELSGPAAQSPGEPPHAPDSDSDQS
jgi:hypothetical protein